MTAPIDIRADHLRIVQDVLHRHLPAGVKVWVFGSRASWATKDSSDLDLALDAETEIPRQSLSALEAAFEDSDLPFAVDIVDTKRIGACFKRIVTEQRVPLPENEGLRATDSNRGGPLGVLPPDWECSTLGAACERGGGNIQTGPFGSQLHASDYQPVGIPSIMPQNLGDNRVIADGIARIGDSDASRLRRYLVRKGDIVYSRRGDVEKRALIGPREDGWLCGTGCLRVRLGRNGADPRYASYYLGHPAVRDWIVRHAHGAAMPNLNTAILSACPFVIPPLSEQRAIAHILGTLDEKIELNRRMNATLEAMARALFRSWFVDFDPVRAKIEGRDTGLPTDIADLFPDRLVDSELGDAPEGWNVDSLAEHFDPVKGVSYKGSGLGGAGMPLHNLNSVHEGGGYKYEGIKFYAGDYAERHVVRPGDVIVANTEQGHDRLLIAYAAIVPRCFGDQGIFSHHVYRLRPRRGGNLSPLFLHQLLNSRWMHDIVSRYANGTTVNMLPMDAVQKPMVLVPPKALLETFDALALDLEHRREQTVRESRSLGVVRDALLPKLVSGEVRVAGLEAPSGHPGLPAAVGTHGA